MPKKKDQTGFTKHSISEVKNKAELNAFSTESIEISPGSEDWTIHQILKTAFAHEPKEHRKILDYLLKLGAVTQAQAKTLAQCLEKGVDVADCMSEHHILKEDEIGQALASYFKKPYVSFREVSIPPEILTLIPRVDCLKRGVVAYDEVQGTLKVALANPADTDTIRWAEKQTGKKVDIHYTTPHQIREAAKSYPSEIEDQLKSPLAGENLPSLDNISQFFDSLALLAYQRGASDIHIEPFEKEVRVRFRVDGVLHTVTAIPRDILDTAVNHIKVLAHLRIDAHNLAQDGRFKVIVDEATINFRVSVMPTYHGEKVVMRLLTSETQEWSLEELGYEQDDRTLIEKGIAKTSGMILVCGPTGSGKTTTLYALLKELNTEGINISTIEDPIEYALPGILQIQVNPNTNITYAEGLKSLMRQDPDILMIGEIRDFETGKIAMNSALTGHLVFSTLHTNNASLAPLRLLQMGVDPYLVVTTVNLIVAQRLVRKICQGCKTSHAVNAPTLSKIKQEAGLTEAQTELFDRYFCKKGAKIRLYKGAGCPQCGGSGYHGRTVIAETLKLQDNIRDLILHSRPESEIQTAAVANGMTLLFEDGLKKVAQGITTMEEMLRVMNQ